MATCAKRLKSHPAILGLSSFLLAIISGTIVLKLHIAATNSSIPRVDAYIKSKPQICEQQPVAGMHRNERFFCTGGRR